MPNNECYQLLISDGKESSHKVCLDRKYTDQMIISTQADGYDSFCLVSFCKNITKKVLPTGVGLCQLSLLYKHYVPSVSKKQEGQ